MGPPLKTSLRRIGHTYKYYLTVFGEGSVPLRTTFITRAHQWFAARQLAKQRWATCPITQSGFVRVSSNSRVVPEARTPIEAIQLLGRMLALPGHQFWSDDVSIVSSGHVARKKLMGPGQVTDAHLLALAIARRGRLVTLDSGVAEIVPDSTSAARALHLIVT